MVVSSWCGKDYLNVSDLQHPEDTRLYDFLRALAIDAVETYAETFKLPICVGFLYIRYSDDHKVTFRDLLEVLVRQVAERHPSCSSLLHEVYNRHMGEMTRPSGRELLKLLKRFKSELQLPMYYFIDALDEAPTDVQLDLVKGLTSLDAKVFITSRPLHWLQDQHPEAHHFPIVAQDSDLEAHIIHEISRSGDLEAVLAASSPGLRGRLTLTIKRQCGGM